MSATTYWAPVKPGTSLDVVSSFFDKLARAQQCDHATDLELRDSDIPLLNGMCAADPTLERVANDLADAINTHHVIRVWREW